MKCAKLFLFLFIVVVVELAIAVSQTEIKEDINSESSGLKTSGKEINMEQIYKKLEDTYFIIEENRLLSWNLLKSSIAGLKNELTDKMDAAIEGLKVQLMNKIDKSINESKSDYKKISDKFTSEMHRVNFELNDVKLKIDNITCKEVNKVTDSSKFQVIDQNKIISNELKAEMRLQSENIVSELTELNYNNSNTKCENIKNEFGEIKDMIRIVGQERNCADLLGRDKISGIKLIDGITVVCDQDTEGGGWTVFQSRDDLPIRENFYRNWAEYSNGFGNLSAEFWLGLENIHRMTKHTNMELGIEFEDHLGNKQFALYKTFYIENSNEKYRLNLGSWAGGGGDNLYWDNQNKFSTFDQDNDESDGNCAEQYKGAWWFRNCTSVHLNGYHFAGTVSYSPPLEDHGILWVRPRSPNTIKRKPG